MEGHIAAFSEKKMYLVFTVNEDSVFNTEIKTHNLHESPIYKFAGFKAKLKLTSSLEDKILSNFLFFYLVKTVLMNSAKAPSEE